MKTIQSKQSDFQNKRKLTELLITIVTDDEHKEGDNLEMTRQRIEKAAFYLMSILNTVKTCALSFEGETEDKKIHGFLYDVMHQCEIGCGIADSILASASCLTEFQPDNAVEAETQAVEEFGDERPYTGDLAIDNLALMISALLDNSNLPKPLRSGFDKVMTEFINSQLGHDEFNEDTGAPEYIARHLKVFEANKRDAAN